MSKVIRVKYENGVLKPLEPLGFNEGEELVVEVKEQVSEKGIERFFAVVKTKKWRAFMNEEDYYEHVSERSSVP
ncbi:MAG: antitoxin family protein [Desulfurococcales archaeon]|nr:antitoxin family protein [Desulfurococcales archaeon]